MEHYFTNNDNLKSEIRVLKYSYGNTCFSFFSDNGVFSKDRIDYGSSLLVDTFIKNKPSTINNILDVGCGYGFIGIVLSKILGVQATLIDINKRAVHLTERNIKENGVKAKSLVSDVYDSITDKYDCIITNPPIRAGKQVVLKILEDASNYLNETGELWYVIRKDQGVKSIIKYLENKYNNEIIEKSKGYFVIKAKKR